MSSSTVPRAPVEAQERYQGLALLADPIHEYISLRSHIRRRVRRQRSPRKNLIDSPWVSAAVYPPTHSARWVFPARRA